MNARPPATRLPQQQQLYNLPWSCVAPFSTTSTAGSQCGGQRDSAPGGQIRILSPALMSDAFRGRSGRPLQDLSASRKPCTQFVSGHATSFWTKEGPVASGRLWQVSKVIRLIRRCCCNPHLWAGTRKPVDSCPNFEESTCCDVPLCSQLCSQLRASRMVSCTASCTGREGGSSRSRA